MDLDLNDIQGNIVPGFNKDYQAFDFVRFRRGQEGREWLAALQPELASAEEVQAFRVAFRSMKQRRGPDPEHRDGGALHGVSATWINVAISFAGLQLLPGIGTLAGFTQSFRYNRVPAAEPPAAPHREVHALLMVAADHAANLDAELERQRQRMSACGVNELTLLRGATQPGELRGHEHFGFKDAISQPKIAGTDWGNGPPVAAGEFILGQPDQTGKPSAQGLPDWTRNGSFLAFLQLQQHVDTFWNTMRQQAKQFGVRAEDVAEWIVGRNREGAQLEDPPGRLTHIARGYARWLPPAESLRHRIIRRGIPYGTRWQDGQADDGQRGLLFVAYQADIERQFEFTWTRWLGGVGFPIPAAGTDALVGQVRWPGSTPPIDNRTPLAPGSRTALRPASADRVGQTGGIVSLRLPAFVTPRNGGYFFAPGIGALSQIAGSAAH